MPSRAKWKETLWSIHTMDTLGNTAQPQNAPSAATTTTQVNLMEIISSKRRPTGNYILPDFIYDYKKFKSGRTNYCLLEIRSWLPWGLGNSDCERLEGASGVLGRFYFLIWVLVTQVGSLCESSSDCTLEIFVLSCMYSTFQSKAHNEKTTIRNIRKKSIRLKNMGQRVEKIQFTFFSEMHISTQFRRRIGRKPNHYH